MREVVLRTAARLGYPTEVGDFTLADLEQADELFLTNAVRGIRPVGVVEAVKTFPSGPVTARLRQAIEAAAE
jgi:branched-subunit amino acid aminotransferase/4-amino-4-deoxychorismate lyase